MTYAQKHKYTLGLAYNKFDYNEHPCTFPSKSLTTMLKNLITIRTLLQNEQFSFHIFKAYSTRQQNLLLPRNTMS